MGQFNICFPKLSIQFHWQVTISLETLFNTSIVMTLLFDFMKKIKVTKKQMYNLMNIN